MNMLMMIMMMIMKINDWTIEIGSFSLRRGFRKCFREKQPRLVHTTWRKKLLTFKENPTAQEPLHALAQASSVPFPTANTLKARHLEPDTLRRKPTRTKVGVPQLCLRPASLRWTTCQKPRNGPVQTESGENLKNNIWFNHVGTLASVTTESWINFFGLTFLDGSFSFKHSGTKILLSQ